MTFPASTLNLLDLRDRSNPLEVAMRFIIEGSAGKIEEDFFHSCAQMLSDLCQAQYAFIAQKHDKSSHLSNMLVLWDGQSFIPPYTFDLADTPCQFVFQQQWGIFPRGLRERFPKASALATLGAESYVAVVIHDASGKAIGNLGIIHTAPLEQDVELIQTILQLFAIRVGAEIERSQAHQKLQAQEQFLRAIYGGTQQPMFVVDTDSDQALHYVSLNTSAEAFFGCNCTAIQGKTPEELYGHGIGDTVQQFLRECAATGDSQSYEYYQPSTGNWWLIKFNPIEASQGQAIRIIGTIFDITEIKQAQSKLQIALKDLRHTQAQIIQSEKMSSLGQLVAGIAHEINNPITFIHGNLDYINRHAEDLLTLIDLYQSVYPEKHDAIAAKHQEIDLPFIQQDFPKIARSIQAGTERVRDIVRSLRTFSRLDEAEVKPVDLHGGIDSTLMLLQHRIQADPKTQGIQIVKDYGELPLVECFSGLLNQVFMHLLSNAIDAFVQQPVPHPQIHIATNRLDRQWAQIRFVDNGPGIAEEIQTQMFDPFFTTKPVGQGTGLGLSITYQIIVEKHNGRLYCHSSPGHGCEFVIEIPLKIEQ